MKTLSKIMLLSIIVSFVTAFTKPGGEGFEIYLNNKLVAQQFGDKMNQVPSIKIDRNSVNDKLTLKYYHCGQSGKNRLVLIKDNLDNTIKTYRYPDTTPVTAMEIPLKDVLVKNGISLIKIYYSSSLLPKGRTVLEMKTGNQELAAH
jgi:hypothetical protein